MRLGDKGADVQEMQESLLASGQKLPKYDADGDYGQETLAAVRSFQFEKGLSRAANDGVISDETLDALGWDAPEDPSVPGIPTRRYEGVKCYDLREEPWEDRVAKKFKRHGGVPVVRDPAQVTGITIHQTAAKYGVVPYQIQAAGGDAELALARRSLRVACHVMAFHKGFIAWPNNLEDYVYHGNGFNAFELGLEIDGNYPGAEGGKTWNNKKPTKVTPEVIRSACAAIELMVVEGREMGMPIEYIHAHRQSSNTRRDDPGEELWRTVVLGYAVPILGLKTEPARTIGKGQPVPRDWDPRGVGRY